MVGCGCGCEVYLLFGRGEGRGRRQGVFKMSELRKQDSLEHAQQS